MNGEKFYKSSFSNADENVDLIIGIPSFEKVIRPIFMTTGGDKVLDTKSIRNKAVIITIRSQIKKTKVYCVNRFI